MLEEFSSSSLVESSPHAGGNRVNSQVLDFERPIAELKDRIHELQLTSQRSGVSVQEEISVLEKKARRMQHDIFSKLTRWQRTQLARHPNRPYSLDFIRVMMTDFIELHGDRLFGDDPAIVGGLARLEGHPVVVVGHQKGRDTKEKIRRNFGMAHPEGYRKALRLMKLAEKFSNPIITLIDTPGAYPGIEAEERGQAEAIARNLREMAELRVPLIAVIIGEGGSGGALALAMGNKVLMLQYAIYSVISPEGCAAILWRDSNKAEQAADALQLTADDLLRLGVTDEIVKEPPGGAHTNHSLAASILRRALRRHLRELSYFSPSELIKQRDQKFRNMGQFLSR